MSSRSGKLLPGNVHGFYAQNCACLIYADVDGAEQSRKASGAVQLLKEDERADQHQRQFVSSMVPLK